LAVASSAWPIVSAAALLAAIAFTFLAMLADPSSLDQPSYKRRCIRTPG
jgi:hypothetical protein